MPRSDFVPYCGTPAVPDHLAWNIDPVLVGAFVLAGSCYLLAARRAPAPDPRARLLFGLGLVIAAAAFLSPLCNLSVALFSARVTQHVILTLVAAPLLVLGRVEILLCLMSRRSGLPAARASSGASLVLGGATFAAALWIWHLPGPYDATLQDNTIYWIMHVTTFGSALVLWHGLLRQGAAHIGAALLVGFGTAVQMSLLGAVLTLSGRALFSVHQGTTWPWGLSPLEDQQFGGLIMWVPAGLLFTLYAVAACDRWLHRFASAGKSANSGARSV